MAFARTFDLDELVTTRFLVATVQYKSTTMAGFAIALIPDLTTFTFP